MPTGGRPPRLGPTDPTIQSPSLRASQPFLRPCCSVPAPLPLLQPLLTLQFTPGLWLMCQWPTNLPQPGHRNFFPLTPLLMVSCSLSYHGKGPTPRPEQFISCPGPCTVCSSESVWVLQGIMGSADRSREAQGKNWRDVREIALSRGACRVANGVVDQLDHLVQPVRLSN